MPTHSSFVNSLQNSVAALEIRLQIALRDGAVEEAEAKGLLAAMQRDGVTESELNHLHRRFYGNYDAFRVPAQELIAPVVSPALHLADGENGVVEDPPTMEDHEPLELEYGEVDGQLIMDGISPSDVKQGYAGDCYLVAAFGAVANKHPELIENAFSLNEDGTLTVSLYKSPSYDEKVEVVIDGDLPLKADGTLHYAREPEARELWVPLLEKAFAVAYGGSYDDIGNSGNTGAAVRALTGGDRVMTDYLMNANPDEVYANLEAGFRDDHVAVAGTFADEGLEEGFYDGKGIYANHAYSVLGVEEREGEKFVKLRNPWGYAEPGKNPGKNGEPSDGANDGVFLMPVEEFIELFSYYEIVEAKAQPVES